MGKQADTYGNANDSWSFLRSGNFTVDPATKAQAQADIAVQTVIKYFTVIYYKFFNSFAIK